MLTRIRVIAVAAHHEWDIGTDRKAGGFTDAMNHVAIEKRRAAVASPGLVYQFSIYSVQANASISPTCACFHALRPP